MSDFYRYEETVNSLCPMTMFFAFASLLFWLPFIFEGRWADFSTFWLFLCTARSNCDGNEVAMQVRSEV